MNDLNLVSQRIQGLVVSRQSKQEVLLNAVQQAINELFDSAESAENSNEVENYLRIVKPLTDALIACARIQDGV